MSYRKNFREVKISLMVAFWLMCCGGLGSVTPAQAAEGWLDVVDDTRLTSDAASSCDTSLDVDGSGNVHIAWYDYRDDSWEIYYTKIYSDGTTAVADTKITSDSAPSAYPSLGLDASGNVHIAWSDWRNNGYSEIYYTKLDNNGNTVVDDTRLTSDSYESNSPSLGVDDSGNVHIAWYDRRDFNYEIYYTKLDNNGNTVIDDTRLTFDSGHSYEPSLGVDSSGNAHIAWYDGRDGNWEIYYTKLDNAGNTVIDDTRLTHIGGSSSSPSLGLDDSGNVHIAWQDNRGDVLNYEIYYTKLDNNGNTVVDDTRLTSASANSRYPSLGWDDSGNVHIAWHDYRDGNNEIYYTKLYSDGATAVDDIRLTSDSASSDWPSLGVDSAGNVHIAWRDGRDGNDEIYYTKGVIATCVDVDGDGYYNLAGCGTAVDCNDNIASINPGAAEICDGGDNDCDEGTADGFDEAWYGSACDGADVDLCDEGSYVCSAGAPACDDYTGNDVEICDGVDNDCDTEVDEGFATSTFYRDADGDGYGDSGITTQTCFLPSGYVTDDTDCDDGDNTVYPGASELCDGKDNDCDTIIPAIEADTDEDGYRMCDNDCDDTDNTIYPGAPELCDTIDNNCDGEVDEDCGKTWVDVVDDTRLTFDIKSSYDPSLGLDSSGNVHIAWYDKRDGNHEIYYTKLYSDGTTAVDDTRLTSDIAVSSYPSLGLDNSGNVHIAWEDRRDGVPGEIYYTKLYSDGTTAVDDTRLTSDSAVSNRPSLGVDSSGNVHIAWEDRRDFNDEIYYTKLDNNGNTVRDDTRLTIDVDSSVRPSLGVDSSGNVHIAWQDWRDGNWEIYYTRLDNNGNTVRDDTRLTSDSAMSMKPSLGVDDSGNVHIAWYDSRDLNNEIYYTKLYSDGTTAVGDTRLTSDVANSLSPSLGLDASGNVHIAWYDYRDSSWEIYYTNLDNNGSTAIDDTRITSTSATSGYPSLGVDSSGNVHIAWQDLRNGNYEIYYTKGVIATCVDVDGDGYYNLARCGTAVDCNDSIGSINPGAAEICDNIDNDCNPATLDGADEAWLDSACDGLDTDLCEEGTNICSGGIQVCTDYSGNDVEVCDGLDNDCDTVIPSNEANVDLDGYRICEGDCNDGDDTIYPGASELCDGKDNDCDTIIPAIETDGDEDGYRMCDADCNDSDDTIYPGAPELCDGKDNDCDTTIPADETTDGDGDGYLLCEDCDDTVPGVNPGAAELCDTVDNDCDGEVDEGCDKTWQDIVDETRLTSDSADSLSPSLGVDSSGNVHIAWLDTRDGNDEIYYTKLYSDGATAVDDTRLTSGSVDNRQPSLGVDSSGNVHIAFWDYPGNEIYYTKLYSDGTTAVEDTRLTSAFGISQGTKLAVDNSGNIHIAWFDGRDGVTNREIYYTKLDNNGNTVVDDTRLTSDSGISYMGDLGVDGSGNVHITWYDNRDGNCEIYYTQLYSDGATAVDDTRLTSGSVDHRQPSLGVDSFGNVHIAWADYRNSDYEIYYTKLDNDGNTVVDDTRLTSYIYYSYRISLGVDSSGNVHIGWSDERDGNHEIYYTRLDNNGNTVIDDTRITSDSAASYMGDLGVDSSGNVHIAWYDNRDGNYEIYYTKGTTTTCIDVDGDGYALEGGGCGLIDCDDTLYSINPGAAEICDGLDNDCDTEVDEGVTTTFYRDVDNDTYGDSAITTQACSAPEGYVADDTDCDDTDDSVYPGAPELCNGIDDDCDTVIPFNETDTDEDGYRMCDADCNDSDDTTYPGAPELCNGKDDDCDTIIPSNEADTDEDGYMVCENDCDDTIPSINPGAAEICDGVDNNCYSGIDEGGVCEAAAEEIVVGFGSAGDSWIRAFDDAASGYAHLAWVNAGWPDYNTADGEIRVALGDVDGDGLDEFVVGFGSDGGGKIRVFDDADAGYAHLAWIKVSNLGDGSTRPACGDVDGDGLDEIIVGFGSGAGGWIRIFDDADAGYASLAWKKVSNLGDGSTTPACGDVDGDGSDEIIVGYGPAAGGWVRVFDDAGSSYGSLAWIKVSNLGDGSTRPALGDVDGDGLDEIVVGYGPAAGGWLRVFDDAVTGSGYGSLRWLKAGWIDYNTTNGETWPAVGNIK